ncbi:cell division control protein 45 [Favolaschia claudopus]|uniref:Cell division control protein 45 n=1 Tax=Favolaschia claudopus TaxID=2862362 RepID=A0AAW0AQU7_9AGAR
MVYLPLPDQASASKPSYAEAYANILKAHRQSPLTSAASVIILVAPDVDALCASRMLADLLKQDDVMYRIIPVSGVSELEKVRDELAMVSELHTLILLNMGAILDLPSEEWFGGFSTQMSVHVIDSARPQNLSSLFGGGEAGDRIVVWDDGSADKLEQERKAWEALTYEPLPDSDDEDSDLDSDEEPIRDDDDEEEYEQTTGKRRSLGEGDRSSGKRQRVDRERPRRMTRDDYDMYSARLEKHYMGGTWHGQSAAGTIYILATILERVDNELLWLAILGLTFQYTTSRISRDTYDIYHSAFRDEVFRLNPPPPTGENAMLSMNPDDLSVRATDELRFMLFRHWTLYDAMLHSGYVAGKLGIWKERGRKRLTGLLAKMGFSLLQTQQPYSHMDLDLKKTLVQKLNDVAPLYGLVELAYPSFIRCFGYRSQPLSAADAVEGISALLDVAEGIKLEVEVEGARNGGEWFGGGKIWEATSSMRDNSRRKREERGEYSTRITKLRESLTLSMTVHRKIIDQGTSIIDRRDIRTMRNHRVVILTQGRASRPLLASRETAITTRSKRKSLPFVVACLNESTQSYLVVGVMAALDFGDVRKNEFGLAFLDAKERCNARTRHGSFDTSVLEINQEDLKVFLETLCEGADA